jgi:hypothetical protein
MDQLRIQILELCGKVPHVRIVIVFNNCVVVNDIWIYLLAGMGQLWLRDKRLWIFVDDVDQLLNVNNEQAKQQGFY